MSKLTQATFEAAFKNQEAEKKAAADIAKNLLNGAYDISLFVESLGFALTSSTVELRANGTSLLSSTLLELPTDYLTIKQMEFLSTFYADRLKDHHSVIPAVIVGIEALIKMKNFPKQNIPILLRNFFQNTTCQSQVRSDRAKLFSIFKYLTTEYKEELVNMSADFIYGLINSIDGERDPRNLDFIFTFMPDVITNYPLLHLAEDMFEIFACYFPIDFTPNKNDPDTITRDNLAEKLTNCLAAKPDFVEWAVPLALEKLESDLTVAKLDSLELLRQLALKQPPAILEPHFEQIWSAIKVETFPGTDNTTVVQMGLKTLGALLERAGNFTEISKNYQTIILSHILPHLSDVNQRLFNPSTSIALICITGDAKFAGEKILNTFLLKIQSTDEPLNEEQRIRIYNILAQIFKITTIRNTIDHLDGKVCSDLHADLINSLRSTPDDTQQQTFELKTAALSVFNESVLIINESNRALLYRALVQLITQESSDLEFSHLLEGLGALYPIELQSNCIDICIRNFPIFSNFIKRKILKNLLPLVKQIAFTQRVLDLIFNNTFNVDTPYDVRLLALEALNTLLANEDQRFIKDLQENHCLIDKLVKLAQKQPTMALEALEQIAAALNHIIQQLAIPEQFVIATVYLRNLNLQLASDLFVAKGLLGFLHQDISLDDDFERLLTDLTELTLQSDDEILREVAHHLLCSLVNKIELDDKNCGVIKKTIHKLKDEIKKGHAKAVETIAWLGKGLTVRGCNDVAEIMGALAELLDHPSLSTAATLAFAIVSAECPQLHLPVIKVLFKQKFFHMVVSKLGEKLNAYSEHHLNAFIYVLKATPHAVLKMNITKVGLILFKSLESTEVHTLCIALEICENFIKHQDEYFRSHLQHIIPSCLQLSTYKKSMQVRILALNLLNDITKYPTFVLLPYKVDVTLELTKALNDQKRLVRNAAVKASNSWYLVGAPNTD